MPELLDDKVVKGLPAPERGNRIIYDAKEPGFGCRVTAAGAKSFVVNYRTRDGRERRYTIGSASAWKVTAAREFARDIKAGLRAGRDPLEQLEGERKARRELAAQATMDTLCDRFEAIHIPKLRPSTQADYRSILKLYVRPDLGKLKVREVAGPHVERLHRKISLHAPRRANVTVAVLSKMFGFAAKTPASDDIDTPMRADGMNPAAGVDRNQENRRQRYLDADEIAAVMKALGALEDQQAADIIKLLILTGCRKSELLSARWAQFNLLPSKPGWTKPAASTKQKTEHFVPLSEPARQVLSALLEKAQLAAREEKRPLSNDAYVFPGRSGERRVELRRAWLAACKAAGLVTTEVKPGPDGALIDELKPSARIHDLRHTYASFLASNGASLPIIGALLGHTQASTTQRYAHLMDDPLRRATEQLSSLVTPKADDARDSQGRAT